MDEETYKMIASQLRKPTGNDGLETGVRMNTGNKFINLYTIEAMDIQPNDHILEIGMGNGYFVKDILAKHDSVRYAGLDFSEDMVSESIKMNQKSVEEGKTTFTPGDGSDMPFADNSFDKIFTINTIYFWEDQTKVFQEFKRVLKNDGQIYISVRPKSTMEKYPFVKYGFNVFSKDDLCQLIEQNKFKVTEVIEKEEPLMDKYGQSIAAETLIIIAKNEI